MEAIRRAASIDQRRRVAPTVSRTDRPTSARFRKDDAHWLAYVSTGWELGRRNPSRLAPLTDETFRAVQQLQAGDIAVTTVRVAARFAAGDDALGGLVRQQQDLAAEWGTLDRQLIDVLGRPPAERDRSLEDGLHRRLGDIDTRLSQLDREITLRFPEYKQLVSAEPASVGEVQQLLAPDEALLVYVVRSESKKGRETPASFVWLVRRERALMARLDLDPARLANDVRALRAQLDPAAWKGGVPPLFDTALAHRLYAKLLPFDRDLLAPRHLLIVPDGPLESLPFSVLVRTKPREGASYREVDWLARSYATTTLPSVSSLRALRRFAKPARATEPFRGVGDPVLTGPAGPARGVDMARLLTRGLANPAEVRALPPLPETADELRTLARDLGAGEDALLLRERATEATVKAGFLSGARVVAFATHAGVAGELPGLAEPALVLTPPMVASEEDDGLLTASEAAQLKLDAEMVLLSACNTAAPDGTPGAPGLSGLAKAFIYAGSRALLVSHWAVLSDAAERLTTGMFAELARDPSLGRAEALRRAEMALLDEQSHPGLSHPSAWAPFVVVGEGRTQAPADQASTAVP